MQLTTQDWEHPAEQSTSGFDDQPLKPGDDTKPLPAAVGMRTYVGHLKRLVGTGTKALEIKALKGALRSVSCGAVMTGTKG